MSLTTHIADVVNAVWYEDLSDIVLLGYSYGGVVVTGALEHIGDRVRHLVYLDAFVPGDGDTVAGLGGATAESGLAALGRDWLVPPLPREYDDPAEAAWAGPRRTPHPAGCFTEPVRLARPLEDYPFTRTYIKATGEPRPDDGHPFWAAADRAMDSPAWRYREIATNHDASTGRDSGLLELTGGGPRLVRRHLLDCAGSLRRRSTRISSRRTRSTTRSKLAAEEFGELM